MKKILCAVLCFIIILSSCRKHDTTPDTSDKTIPSSYKIDTAAVYPSSLVTITSSNVITKDTADITIGSKQVTVAKLDSFHYTLMVPILPAGNYPLNLSALNSTNNITLNISNYTPISDPNKSITDFETSFNMLIDTLGTNKSTSQAADIQFAKQLIQVFQNQFSQLSASQQLIIAYQIQRITAEEKISVNLIKQKLKVFDVTDPTAAELEATDASIKAENIKAEKAMFAFEASLALAVAVPPPANVIFAATALTNAIDYFNNSAHLKLAVNIFEYNPDIVETINPASTIIVTNTGKPTLLTFLSSKFRTVRASDINAAEPEIENIDNDISQASSDNQTFNNVFDNFKSKFSNLASSISASLTIISKSLPTNATEATGAIPSQNLVVQNVSNPNIVVSASSNGANGLNITATNPSGNITAATRYTIDIVYSQPEFANTIKVTEQVNYEPAAMLKIGDTYAGGIIFYLDATGKHGLVCAPFDQTTSKGIQWDPNYDGVDSTYNPIVTGATDTTVGSGLANTNKIVAALGNSNNAAALCKNLSLNGYNDWYLPSFWEAINMWVALVQQYRFVPPAPNYGFVAPISGNEATYGYWSSTEFSDALSLHPGQFTAYTGKDALDWTGWSTNVGYRKYSYRMVRAIRKF